MQLEPRVRPIPTGRSRGGLPQGPGLPGQQAPTHPR